MVDTIPEVLALFAAQSGLPNLSLGVLASDTKDLQERAWEVYTPQVCSALSPSSEGR
jgi:hypothetical protein